MQYRNDLKKKNKRFINIDEYSIFVLRNLSHIIVYFDNKGNYCVMLIHGCVDRYCDQGIFSYVKHVKINIRCQIGT